MEILRLSDRQLINARMQLTQEGLIDYRRPYWWVKEAKAMEDVKQRIQYLRDVMHLSFRQIGWLTGISRKRVSKIYQGCSQEKENRRICTLDQYWSLIRHWFNEYPSLKAIQVYKWLKERGVEISYPSVVKHTKTFRRKRQKA